MTIDEFSKLTGFHPTVSMYETIEKAYMESKMDKKEFCEAYKTIWMAWQRRFRIGRLWCRPPKRMN